MSKHLFLAVNLGRIQSRMPRHDAGGLSPIAFSDFGTAAVSQLMGVPVGHIDSVLTVFAETVKKCPAVGVDGVPVPDFALWLSVAPLELQFLPTPEFRRIDRCLSFRFEVDRSILSPPLVRFTW